MVWSLVLRRFGPAILAVAVALLLARLFEPWLEGPSVYLVIALPVLVTARRCGRGPALLATVLVLLAALFARSSSRPLHPSDAVGAGLFLLLGAAIAWNSRAVDRSPVPAQASQVPDRPEATAAEAPPASDLEAAWQQRDTERRLRRQLSELHEVSLELSGLTSRDDLCRRAIELGRERLGFDRLGLWLQMDEPEVIHGTFGTDEQGRTRDERGLRLPIHVIPLAAQLLDGSARVVRRDHATLYGDQGNPVGRGTHVIAGLWEAERFLGFLSADNLLSDRPISEPEAELLGLYAAAIGHLCIRLQAEEALRESRDTERDFCRQLAALHDISLELSTAPDLDTLSRRAIELGRTRIGFERLGLWFQTDQPDRVRGSFGTDETGQTIDEREATLPVLPGTASELVLSAKARVARIDDTVLFTWQDQEVRGTQLVAGLWNGQQAIGYLSTDNRLWGRPITERQRVLLELYAAALGRLCTLKQREEALHEADRRKDQSLALLVHELRNPLAPIKNAVELLKAVTAEGLPGCSDRPPEAADTPAGSPAREAESVRRAAAVIERQLRHQARLLDDLLDLSRIGQGKIELHCSPLDLVRLVRDTVEDRRGVLESAGLALTLDLPERPLWVNADSTRLTQVVGNLLTNAGKFTSPGGRVTVSLSAHTPATIHGDAQDLQDSPQQEQFPYPVHPVYPCEFQLEPSYAILTVADTGIGIDAEMLPRVFEPFAQADHIPTCSQKGLGLGLALVRGLVERHGGQVHAASDGPGRGARFTITLPTVEAPAPTQLIRPTAPVLGGPLRILIVEDHPDAAETLRELLEFVGCTVEVAQTGLEGIEKASQFRPELLLCDLALPGLDGFAVAAALRTLPETAHIRMIALTGHGLEEDQRRAREAGFDLHLTKPIDFDELWRLLEVAPRQPEGGTII